MNSNLLTVVPECLQSSLLCYTFIDSRILDSAPNISSCHSNGYLYEVRDKIVIRSLDLNEEKGFSISSYLIFEECKFIIYYLIYTVSKKILLIRRNEKILQILKVYDNIKKFKVFDFMNLGYPQIKISLTNSTEEQIIDFKTQKVIKHEKCETLHDSEYKEEGLGNDVMVNTLLEKLQMVKIHIDELKEEQKQLKKICLPENCSQKNFSGAINSGKVTFSSTIKKEVKPEIAVLEKWDKIFGIHFILGLKIRNSGVQTVTDLALYIHHKMIKKYTFCFFSLTEESFCPLKAEASIKPGEEMFLVGSFEIPVFKFESKLSVSYYLYSFNLEDYLVKGTLELNITDLAAQKNFLFEQDFRDLMAVKTLKIETKITVKTKEVSPNLIETLLLSKLNFKQIQNLTEKFFYCDSAFLMEVFILIKEVSSESTTWKMNWYTSDNNQIYFLVNALYDLLPDGTSILPEENQADTSYQE